jgi:hypothetical protein
MTRPAGPITATSECRCDEARRQRFALMRFAYGASKRTRASWSPIWTPVIELQRLEVTVACTSTAFAAQLLNLACNAARRQTTVHVRADARVLDGRP